MAVLDEIVQWAKDRPIWQRDALRRLFVAGELSPEDLRELTALCKASHGLAEYPAPDVLSKEHISLQKVDRKQIALASIFHHRGVNALAEDQTLMFGPRLTVVYGDNAAGKTGYIRILKSACRARGAEQILGNVTGSSAPRTPSVAIKYFVGDDPEEKEWSGVGDDENISRVSVFDTQSASVYLTEKTDVAFRPFGLDLFDKLVQACKSVRLTLESEQRGLGTSTLDPWQAAIPSGTATAKLVGSLSSLTKPEAVHALARLSPAEDARLALLEKSLLDLQANDPKKLSEQLSLRSGRIRLLAQHLKQVERALSPEAIAIIIDVRTGGRRKREQAKLLRDATFQTDQLSGTGGETWTHLWESARRFSEEDAYPEQKFPVVNDAAHCLLCQQILDQGAAHRLAQFEAFVTSTTERELRELRERFARLRKDITDLRVTTVAVDETIKEIRVDNDQIATSIGSALGTNESRRVAVVEALTKNADVFADLPDLIAVSQLAMNLADQLDARAKLLKTDNGSQNKLALTNEVQELRARKLLAENIEAALAEIERKKKVAAYELCLNDTKTHAITQKSTALTKAVVTATLQNSFKTELDRLNFRNVEVALSEVGGTEGVLYHKLVLTRAPGVNLPKVVSEGEQRCLSIAAFFAELSTADDMAGIVFDDPVSSLDYKFRDAVAKRLVEEARSRQVIVFTHDVVFLLMLKQLSEELGVTHSDQHVRQLSAGAGVCAAELPWVAMATRRKLGHLKKELQDADKLFREGHVATYEREAKILYGLLRETWERAIEEVLLNNIVERFRPSVQTQHISTITDISVEDCKTLEAAMTKCSRWLVGHDKAAAAIAPVPEPNELRADIATLEQWISTIRGRRK